jgi:hypothetical protein
MVASQPVIVLDVWRSYLRWRSWVDGERRIWWRMGWRTKAGDPDAEPSPMVVAATALFAEDAADRGTCGFSVGPTRSRSSHVRGRYLFGTPGTLERCSFATSKEAGHVPSRHVGTSFDVVDDHRLNDGGGSHAHSNRSRDHRRRCDCGGRRILDPSPRALTEPTLTEPTEHKVNNKKTPAAHSRHFFWSCITRCAGQSVWTTAVRTTFQATARVLGT